MQRLALILVLLWPAIAERVQAADAGERLFNLHCAACHGRDARGTGAIGETLNGDPSDLTRLTHRNSGVFPFADVVAKIDGRILVAEHGGEMPVYGWFFKSPAAAVVGIDGKEIVTTEAIAQITYWLATMQR